MRADSVHGSIGSKLQSTSQIEDFEGFSSLCNRSRESIRCVHMENK